MPKTARSKFTLLDMSLMITAALLLLSVFLRESIIEAFKKTEHVNISYVFEIPQIEQEKVASITGGTQLAINGTEVSLGSVTALTSVTTASTTQNINGTDEIQALDPRLRSVMGTAEITLEKLPDGYYTSDGRLFAAGCTFEVFCGTSVFTLRIARIEILE